MKLETFAVIAEIAASIATIAAVVAAAGWFLKRRQTKIAADLAQDVSLVALGDGRLLVKVIVRCHNVGPVAFYPVWTHATVQRLAPLDAAAMAASTTDEPVLTAEIGWPVLARAELRHGDDSFVIEAGETHTWTVDLIVADHARVGQVHTMVYGADDEGQANEVPQWPSARREDERAAVAKIEAALGEMHAWEAISVIDLAAAPKP